MPPRLEAQARQVRAPARGRRRTCRCGLHQAADVGIVAGHRAFEKRGVDDRLPQPARAGAGSAAPRTETRRISMPHALAVANDILRQVAMQTCLQGAASKAAWSGARHAARRNQRNGVRGARVAVDADGVEARIHRAGEHRAQLRARHREIGQKIDNCLWWRGSARSCRRPWRCRRSRPRRPRHAAHLEIEIRRHEDALGGGQRPTRPPAPRPPRAARRSSPPPATPSR